jgi:hypothetical protein
LNILVQRIFTGNASGAFAIAPVIKQDDIILAADKGFRKDIRLLQRTAIAMEIQDDTFRVRLGEMDKREGL